MPRKLKNIKSETIICEKKTSKVKNAKTKHYETFQNVPDTIISIWTGHLLQTIDPVLEYDLYKQKYGIGKTKCFFSCASISGQEFLVRGWRSCPLLPLSVWTHLQLGRTHGDPLPAPIDSVSLYVCHSVVSRRPCFLRLFSSHCLFQSFYYCLDKVLWALKGEVVEIFHLALSIPRLFILCSLSSNRSCTCLCLLQVEDSRMMTMQDTDLWAK